MPLPCTPQLTVFPPKQQGLQRWLLSSLLVLGSQGRPQHTVGIHTMYAIHTSRMGGGCWACREGLSSVRGHYRDTGNLKFSDLVAEKPSFHRATLSSNLSLSDPQERPSNFCVLDTRTSYILVHVYLVFLLRRQVPGAQSERFTVFLP